MEKPETNTWYHDSDDSSFCPALPRISPDINTHVGRDNYNGVRESGDDYNDGRRSVRKRSRPDRLQVTGTGKSYKPQVQSVKVSSFPLRLERGGAIKEDWTCA